MRVSLVSTRAYREAWRGRTARVLLLTLIIGLGVAAVHDIRRGLRERQREREQLLALSHPEALTLGVRDKRYIDPAGRFALTIPAAWVVVDGARAAPYTARFYGPRGIEISVMVTELDHDRFDLLMARIRGQMDEMKLPVALGRIDFQGRPAVERRGALPRSGVYILDFLEGRIAHHILASVPHPNFNRFYPLIRDILATYEAPTKAAETTAPEAPRPRQSADSSPSEAAQPAPSTEDDPGPESARTREEAALR